MNRSAKLKYEEKYARIISGALVHFFFNKGVQGLNLNICVLEDCMTILAEGYVSLNERELKELDILKNPVRLPEFEDYYDSLAGIGSCSSEISNLDTLSSMVDESLIDYGDGKLRIDLIRKI